MFFTDKSVSNVPPRMASKGKQRNACVNECVLLPTSRNPPLVATLKAGFVAYPAIGCFPLRQRISSVRRFQNWQHFWCHFRQRLPASPTSLGLPEFQRRRKTPKTVLRMENAALQVFFRLDNKVVSLVNEFSEEATS